MTREEAIAIFKGFKFLPREMEAVELAIEALKMVDDFERAQIITGGRLNGRTYAYKCGLEDGKRKALKREPCEDIMAIHTQGLDEDIRCIMCTNPMRSDRGCDGGCMIDQVRYEKVMDTIRNRFVSSTTPLIMICGFGSKAL